MKHRVSQQDWTPPREHLTREERQRLSVLGGQLVALSKEQRAHEVQWFQRIFNQSVAMWQEGAR